MLRLFIAVEISKNQKGEITRLQQPLRQYLKGVRWVNPERMHLTLKFLGETEERNVEMIKEGLDNSVNCLSPFTLQFGGSGVFPSPAKARVLWIGVNLGYEPLETIADHIDSQMLKLGFQREKRKFHPHLTLGRMRYPESSNAIKRFIEEQKNFQTAVTEITRITLFQSTLTGKGAFYSVLHHSLLNNENNNKQKTQLKAAGNNLTKKN